MKLSKSQTKKRINEAMKKLFLCYGSNEIKVICMRGTEIRQQLRNQSLESLLITQTNQVGDRIYPDDMAVLDMEALEQIVSAWRATHTATFGQVLPNTGAIEEGIVDGGGVSVDDNQVLDIVGISCANAGGAPIVLSIRLGDLVLINGVVDPTNGLTSSDLGSLLPMTLSKGLSLKFVVTSGTSGDFTAKVAYQYRSI